MLFRSAPGAGSTLHSSWVRGVNVIGGTDATAGCPVGLDLKLFRKALMESQPEYRDPRNTNPATDDPMTAAAENEYRAAMGLDLRWTKMGGHADSCDTCCNTSQLVEEEKKEQTTESPTMVNEDLGTFYDDRVLYESKLNW